MSRRWCTLDKHQLQMLFVVRQRVVPPSELQLVVEMYSMSSWNHSHMALCSWDFLNTQCAHVLYSMICYWWTQHKLLDFGIVWSLDNICTVCNIAHTGLYLYSGYFAQFIPTQTWHCNCPFNTLSYCRMPTGSDDRHILYVLSLRYFIDLWALSVPGDRSSMLCGISSSTVNTSSTSTDV